MNLKSLHNILILAGPILLGGCAASQMHGFENAYQGYSVPEPLVEQIRLELKRVGLTNAQVILEVRSQEDTVVFRNIYAVEH